MEQREDLDIMTARSILMAIHELVWTWREKNEPRFPTPDPQDAIRFAFTEALEALDASLRDKNMYSRNRPDRDLEVGRELADCLFMLITAMGRDADLERIELFEIFREPDLDDVMFLVSDAARGLLKPYRRFRIPHALLGVLYYMWNHEQRLPTVMVSERLARIESRLNGQGRTYKWP